MTPDPRSADPISDEELAVVREGPGIAFLNHPRRMFQLVARLDASEAAAASMEAERDEWHAYAEDVTMQRTILRDRLAAADAVVEAARAWVMAPSEPDTYLAAGKLTIALSTYDASSAPPTDEGEK